jgi:hypothetical protein
MMIFGDFVERGVDSHIKWRGYQADIHSPFFHDVHDIPVKLAHRIPVLQWDFPGFSLAALQLNRLLVNIQENLKGIDSIAQGNGMGGKSAC